MCQYSPLPEGVDLHTGRTDKGGWGGELTGDKAVMKGRQEGRQKTRVDEMEGGV